MVVMLGATAGTLVSSIVDTAEINVRRAAHNVVGGEHLPLTQKPTETTTTTTTTWFLSRATAAALKCTYTILLPGYLALITITSISAHLRTSPPPRANSEPDFTLYRFLMPILLLSAPADSHLAPDREELSW